MRKAALFRNNKSQAVRSPRDMEFTEDVREVEVVKVGKNILLRPVDYKKTREEWLASMEQIEPWPEDFEVRRPDHKTPGRIPDLSDCVEDGE